MRLSVLPNEQNSAHSAVVGTKYYLIFLSKYLKTRLSKCCWDFCQYKFIRNNFYTGWFLKIVDSDFKFCAET